MIVSNAVSILFMKWCFVNKLLVDDTKKVYRGQRVRISYTVSVTGTSVRY